MGYCYDYYGTWRGDWLCSDVECSGCPECPNIINCSNYHDANSCYSHEICYWDDMSSPNICTNMSLLCEDTYDDDNDGKIDCADSDCYANNTVHSTPCPGPASINDSDGDGVLDVNDCLTGNASNIFGGVSNLSALINGAWNNSPSGINTVQIFAGVKKIAQFDWNFSSSNVLNMNSVGVTKTAKGIYIFGVGVAKTIYVNAKPGTGICIKNADGIVSNIARCNGTGEYFLSDRNCNGTSIMINGDSVTCDIANGNYVLSNLTHSGGEALAKGTIPMNSGNPFYSQTSNPYNCGAMYLGD